jgi:hypothetical protein
MDMALSIQALRGGLGVGAAGGSDLPGSGSTLGHRLPGSPRLSVSGRVSLVRITTPDVLGSASAPAGDDSFFVPSAHLIGTIGLLDGFSLAPSVGGILSLDLFGNLHFLAPPEGAGFGDGTGGWGLGGRLGIFRESFTLPGVSVSAGYRSLGDTEWGSWTDGDDAEAEFGTGITSLRAVIGKDLLGLGLLAGAGWDRYTADGEARVRDPGSGLQGDVPVDALARTRRLYFFGGSLTFVVLQASVEVGWADGHDSSFPAGEIGRFDPASGSLFGSFSLRLNF